MQVFNFIIDRFDVPSIWSLVHTTLFPIFWSKSRTFINIEAHHMDTGNVAKLVKHIFALAPWVSFGESRFVCGKCIKKSITLFCWSKSQPTWCMILFIAFVMITEPIWHPMRRLIAGSDMTPTYQLMITTSAQSWSFSSGAVYQLSNTLSTRLPYVSSAQLQCVRLAQLHRVISSGPLSAQPSPVNSTVRAHLHFVIFASTCL